MLKRLIAVAMVVVLCLAVGEGVEAKPVGFEIGADFVGSPGLDDFMDDAYKKFDTDDDWGGWGGVRASLRFNAGDYFAICPGVSLIGHAISVNVYGGSNALEEDYVIYMITPVLTLKGGIPVGRRVKIVLGAEGNYNFPDSNSDAFEFDSGGFGGGAFAGVEIFGRAEILLGYVYMPVEPKTKSGITLPAGVMIEKDYDFGGVLISGKYVF